MKPESTDWRDALKSLMPQGEQHDESASAAEEEPIAPSPKSPVQKLRVDIEKKGRGGKTATIISGFTVSDDEIEKIAAQLKKRLGTGGSARGGEILIQGNRRDDVIAALRSMGYIK